MNYMQYSAQSQPQQQSQQQMPQQQQYGVNNMMRQSYPSPNGWNNRIRPVSSIEEVRAALVDFDGSVFYFSDLANKRIYTKQINLDGTAQINMYELKETPSVMEQPIVDRNNFVTRTEFEDIMNKLKVFLAKQDSNIQTQPQEAQVETQTKPISFDF